MQSGVDSILLPLIRCEEVLCRMALFSPGICIIYHQRLGMGRVDKASFNDNRLFNIYLRKLPGNA